MVDLAKQEADIDRKLPYSADTPGNDLAGKVSHQSPCKPSHSIKVTTPVDAILIVPYDEVMLGMLPILEALGLRSTDE